ncbi:MAG TPA: hypothetical protein VFZ59_16825 [Verrucomicrobiae bacterium]|nr:hypothetical protein [Verrucomicrobiae bacterium]
MSSRSKSNKRYPDSATGRGSIVLLAIGVLVVLALVATLLWLISSPELVKPD